MGLTVHYDLKLGVASAAKARQVLERLRRHALKLPFAKVKLVHEIDVDREDEDAWPDGLQLLQRGDLYYDVFPTRGFQFHTLPGEGTEVATFGLCEYPKTIVADGRRVRTKLTGWCWHDFCKTQYASNPKYGGVENFIQAHVALIELLDYARELGLETKVHDEGRYAERRDVDALREEVADWNGLVAGMVGTLKDAFPGGSEAPILDYPDFERHEARGRPIE